MFLAKRRFTLKQFCDAEVHIRGTLRNFGLRVGKVTRRRLEARILGLVVERPERACLVKPMLRARAALLAEYVRLHRMMLEAVRADPVCHRLMTVPGVGPVTALTFRTSVEVPSRFARSLAVSALSCSVYGWTAAISAGSVRTWTLSPPYARTSRGGEPDKSDRFRSDGECFRGDERRGEFVSSLAPLRYHGVRAPVRLFHLVLRSHPVDSPGTGVDHEKKRDTHGASSITKDGTGTAEQRERSLTCPTRLKKTGFVKGIVESSHMVAHLVC